MPVLTNPRHELFAQGLAKGMTAVDAHEAAGYSRNDGNACRWAAKPEVMARVMELKGNAAVLTEITIASLTAELEEIRGLAVTERQLAAGVGAVREKAILNGLRIEKRENLNRYDPDKISDTDLDALIAAQLAGEPSEQEAPEADPSHVH